MRWRQDQPNSTNPLGETRNLGVSSGALILIPDKGTIHSIINKKGKQTRHPDLLHPPFPFQHLYKSLQSEGSGLTLLTKVAQTGNGLAVKSDSHEKRRWERIKILSLPFCSSASFCQNFKKWQQSLRLYFSIHIPSTYHRLSHTLSYHVLFCFYSISFFSFSDFLQPYQAASSKQVFYSPTFKYQ